MLGAKAYFSVFKVFLFFVTAFLLTICCFLYAISVSWDDHYDVKRGSILWYFTMQEETITDFPIIEPYSKPKYNHIGGDAPGISIGWEIEYWSEADTTKLLSEIIPYIQRKGYKVKRINETGCSGNDIKASDNIIIFSGSKDYQCLELIIDSSEKDYSKIEAIILE